MYPRNAASPEPIGIGAVIQISDGAVQTSGVTVRIKPNGVAEADGAGSISYSTNGVVYYTPTPAETNYTSFILFASKTGCVPANITVITTESSIAGRVYVQTNGDKTNYTISTAGIAAFFNTLTSGFSTVGSVGKLLVDTLTGSIASIPTNPLLTTDTRLNNLNAPIGSIPTNPLLTTDTRLNNLNAPIGSIPTNPLLTTDARLNNLDATISSRSTYAGGDTPGTSQLLGRLTTQRATNLDFLDAAISTVLSTINGLNNLSALANIYGASSLEIPDTGSTDYAFTIVVRDNEGKLVNLDTTPTVTAANAAGTTRSANLSAVSNPSTGRYIFTYSVASTHPQESLRIMGSGTVSGETRYVEWVGNIVNYDTLTTLQAVQNTVNAIDTRLPTLPAAVSDIPTANANAVAVWSNPTRTLSVFNFQVTVGGYAAGQTPLQSLGTNAPAGWINAASIASSALNGKGDWALATNWTALRAGYLDLVLLANNSNQRTITITGNGHVPSVLHDAEPNSIPEDAFQPDSITSRILATDAVTEVVTGVWSANLSGYGANTAGKNLFDVLANTATLVTRIPAATAQLVTDLALMLVGSGTALVKWTATALSLAPAGGGSGGGSVSVTPEAFINLDNTLLEKNVFTFFNNETRTYLVTLASGVFDGQPMTFCIEKSDKTTLVVVSSLTSITNSVSVTVPSVAEQTDKCMQWSLRDSATGRIILYGPAVQKYAAFN